MQKNHPTHGHPVSGRRRGPPRIAGACLFAVAITGAAQDLRVLHWWQSASERQATEVISSSVRHAGLGWVNEDATDGVGAAIILRSRILAHDMPDIAQANSATAHNWATLGLVRNLDRVAAADHWERRLLPAVYRQLRPGNHVLAAPLGVHRMNTLVYNLPVFTRLHLAPPRTWEEFEGIAPRLQRAGIVPLAQSSEPWQVAILFENLLLADGGIALHRRLFVDNDLRAFTSPALAGVLRHLRSLKRWMRHPVPETAWSAIASEVGSGTAAMAISGDWLKGELQARGAQVGKNIGCTGAPGTDALYLFDLDTLVMLHAERLPPAAQESVAQLAVSAGLQERYNRIKGSVSVLRDANPAAMDSCARASWMMLNMSDARVIPSIAIGMAGDEVMRDGLANEVHRFFMDDSITVLDTQRRLAAVSRAFSQNPTP
ncbi:ABC transporter substrate-binding protein [Telluria mixta]|uniref:Probable sugar-binding periplasmic protein n=1 Tax=Telluria mixta TaxID=34071 RepID=A0ABT2BS95_9BURK|nr:ABC transporter substrate-binding protein [Telluria mixta]MCS0627921.1 ABC transporter substrate-binding protein [Telluria mixta]WEM93960.1 ABC transporter substrate-binding protein [Telluria mixta]